MMQAQQRNACKWIAPMVTLVDGTRVPSDSEEWRFQCEAQHVLNLPTREQRQAVLRGEFNPKTQLRQGGLVKFRGLEYVQRLEDVIMVLWRSAKNGR
jgi:hypothetical protein